MAAEVCMEPSAARYAFRPPAPDDVPAIADLLVRVFGVERDPDHLRWKYFRNPAGEGLSTLIDWEGTPVGFLGIIPVRVRMDGEDALAVYGADVAVLEPHQRIDAFMGAVSAAVKRQLAAGARFFYGAPNRRAAEVNAAMLGHRLVRPIPLRVRILDPAPYLEGIGRRRLAGPARLGWGALQRTVLRPRPAPPAGMRLCPADRFDERFDRFWLRVRGDYPVMTVRDAGYLNWRYADPAAGPFRILLLESTGGAEIEGYAVYGTSTVAGRFRGHLLDLVTPRDRGDAAAACLIDGALADVLEQGADCLDVWATPDHHLDRVLASRWFRPRDAVERVLHAKNLAGTTAAAEAALMDRLTAWPVCIGDVDER